MAFSLEIFGGGKPDRKELEGETRVAVLEEGQSGKETYKVHSTPTIMLGSGKKLRHPMAYPNIENGKILSVGKLPCCGAGRYEATRALFEQALKYDSERDIQELS